MNVLQQMVRDGGRKYGRKWATDEASKGQLARLRRLYECVEQEAVYGWDFWFCEQPNQAYTVADRLFFVISPADDGDRDAAATFWEQLDEVDLDDSDFFQGFAEGALGIE